MMKRSQKTLLRVEPELLDGRLPLGDEEALDALIRLWENAAFFGDLILRMPDPVHAMYEGHAVRTELLRYALDLCMKAPVFAPDSPHRELLLLTQQEAGMADDPDPTYENPFREENVQAEVRAAKARETEAARLARKKEKRKQLRKPRLGGGGGRTEL